MGVAIIFFVLLKVNPLQLHIAFGKLHNRHVGSKDRMRVLFEDRLELLSLVFQGDQHKFCDPNKHMLTLINFFWVTKLKHELDNLDELDQLQILTETSAEHIENVFDLALYLKFIDVVMP